LLPTVAFVFVFVSKITYSGCKSINRKCNSPCPVDSLLCSDLPSPRSSPLATSQSIVAPYRRTSSLTLLGASTQRTTGSEPNQVKPPNQREKLTTTQRSEDTSEDDSVVSLDVLDDPEAQSQGRLAKYAPRGPSFILSKRLIQDQEKREVWQPIYTIVGFYL